MYGKVDWGYGVLLAVMIAIVAACLVGLAVLVMSNPERAYYVRGYTPAPGERVVCVYEKDVNITPSGKTTVVTTSHLLHCASAE